MDTALVRKVVVTFLCVILIFVAFAIEELRIKALQVKAANALAQVAVLQSDINQQNLALTVLKLKTQEQEKKAADAQKKATQQRQIYDERGDKLFKETIGQGCTEAIEWATLQGPVLYQNWLAL